MDDLSDSKEVVTLIKTIIKNWDIFVYWLYNLNNNHMMSKEGILYIRNWILSTTTYLKHIANIWAFVSSPKSLDSKLCSFFFWHNMKFPYHTNVYYGHIKKRQEVQIQRKRGKSAMRGGGWFHKDQKLLS